jgi:hypothetical protein
MFAGKKESHPVQAYNWFTTEGKRNEWNYEVKKGDHYCIDVM